MQFKFKFAILLAEVAIMAKTIQAVYENGVFKPLNKLNLHEKQRVEILILEDDLPTPIIAKTADEAGSYDFLMNPDENIYTIQDGERLD